MNNTELSFKFLNRKQVNLETITIFCSDCKTEMPHICLGDYGVPWKHQYVYSCMECSNKYVSIKRLK
jgi:hypothetical protein